MRLVQEELTGGSLSAAGTCASALVCGQHHHPLTANIQLDDFPVLEALGLTHLRVGEGSGCGGKG